MRGRGPLSDARVSGHGQELDDLPVGQVAPVIARRCKRLWRKEKLSTGAGVIGPRFRRWRGLRVVRYLGRLGEVCADGAIGGPMSSSRFRFPNGAADPLPDFKPVLEKVAA